MLRTRLITFRQYLDEAHLIETGQHHEFKTGLHGYKADFSTAAPVGSDLYREWVHTTSSFIIKKYPLLPDVFLGVANGTNRFAIDISRKIGFMTVGLESIKDKDNPRILKLGNGTKGVIERKHPRLTLILEDASTTGSSSAQLVDRIRKHGKYDVEVLSTLQRSSTLPELDERDVPYRALYVEPMDNLKPIECAKNGPCSENVLLIPYEV